LSENTYSYELAKVLVEEKGIVRWLLFLKSKYPEADLYSVSTEWLKDSNFICKAKGTKGHLLIHWKKREETHTNSF
jgi:hypothetical protein